MVAVSFCLGVRLNTMLHGVGKEGEASRLRDGVKVKMKSQTGRNLVWKNGRMEDKTGSLASGSGKDNKSGFGERPDESGW